jgi:hypothetical protein
LCGVNDDISEVAELIMESRQFLIGLGDSIEFHYDVPPKSSINTLILGYQS